MICWTLCMCILTIKLCEGTMSILDDGSQSTSSSYLVKYPNQGLRQDASSVKKLKNWNKVKENIEAEISRVSNKKF